jgi:diguanylate cyclase (GGDEF)-like protein
MHSPPGETEYRLLIVDDLPAIHGEYRRCLVPEAAPDELERLAAELLGGGIGELKAKGGGPRANIHYRIDSAHQGQEGAQLVAQACAQGRPYALAFVDMRMPPGWDGLATIEQLWATDPHLQVVLCTAYSDHTWSEIDGRLGGSDRLLILKKPFDPIEVRQLARALCAKWQMLRELRASQEQLQSTNRRLEAEIDQRTRAEEELLHERLHDAHTGLPNRVHMRLKVEQALRAHLRQAAPACALLFLDLDDFKRINSALGEATADALLKETALRLSAATQSLSGPGSQLVLSIARWGADDFAVLVEGPRAEPEALELATQLAEQLGRPWQSGEARVWPSISAGVVTSGPQHSFATDLLRDAHIALEQAKLEGRGKLVRFDAAMASRAARRMELENDLRYALEGGQLFIQYQPIIDLPSGSTTGLEALLRWRHPRHGLISPAEFVPLAEESALIETLGSWVIDEVCAQIVRWRQAGCQRENHFVSVNLSARQLTSERVVEEALAAVSRHGLVPADLRLELTETLLMENIGLGRAVLERLRAEHFDIYVDDFGTGFSSLAYLGNLPIAAIKLDRSFVHDLCDSPANQATVEAVLALAKGRGLRVIAEGIENPEQHARLLEMGCRHGQGFLYSRPLDADQVPAWLASRPQAASAA